MIAVNDDGDKNIRLVKSYENFIIVVIAIIAIKATLGKT